MAQMWLGPALGHYTTHPMSAASNTLLPLLFSVPPWLAPSRIVLRTEMLAAILQYLPSWCPPPIRCPSTPLFLCSTSRNTRISLHGKCGKCLSPSVFLHDRKDLFLLYFPLSIFKKGNLVSFPVREITLKSMINSASTIMLFVLLQAGHIWRANLFVKSHVFLVVLLNLFHQLFMLEIFFHNLLILQII